MSFVPRKTITKGSNRNYFLLEGGGRPKPIAGKPLSLVSLVVRHGIQIVKGINGKALYTLKSGGKDLTVARVLIQHNQNETPPDPKKKKKKNTSG